MTSKDHKNPSKQDRHLIDFPKEPYRFLQLPVRHPVVVILLVFIISIIAGLRIHSLSFSTSIYDLVIEDIPEADEYRSFQEGPGLLLREPHCGAYQSDGKHLRAFSCRFPLLEKNLQTGIPVQKSRGYSQWSFQ